MSGISARIQDTACSEHRRDRGHQRGRGECGESSGVNGKERKSHEEYRSRSRERQEKNVSIPRPSDDITQTRTRWWVWQWHLREEYIACAPEPIENLRVSPGIRMQEPCPHSPGPPDTRRVSIFGHAEFPGRIGPRVDSHARPMRTSGAR